MVTRETRLKRSLVLDSKPGVFESLKSMVHGQIDATEHHH